MSLYAGLDISVKMTAICVLDANGRVILETMVESAPDAISACLHELDDSFERIGLEAGPLSQWIYAGLVESGLAAICVETRHMHAVLSARINKTDRNDARGIAQMSGQPWRDGHAGHGSKAGTSGNWHEPELPFSHAPT